MSEINFSRDLAALFGRDLALLQEQVRAFPDDRALWQRLPGIANPAGNLVLHLEGNLREFIGRQLGKLPYTRQREVEFSAQGTGRDELEARIAELGALIPAIVGELSAVEMEREFPQVVLERSLSTQAFLVHLYGHLNWHLGQIDYVRRILTGGGAVKRPGI